MDEKSIVRCPSCGVEFDASQIAGMKACPVCGKRFPNVACPNTARKLSSQPPQSTTETGHGVAISKVSAPQVTKRHIPQVVVICIALVCAFAYTHLTIFVIQPIGAIPEGRTVVMWRLNKTNFIDSADAMCERLNHGVSLLCRGAMLGAVAKHSEILLRLPYSETLYLMSTNGTYYLK